MKALVKAKFTIESELVIGIPKKLNNPQEVYDFVEERIMKHLQDKDFVKELLDIQYIKQQ